jgi:hypothetical protein
MHLTTHHKFALAGAAVTSAIALFDAATHGLTGQYSWFADDSGIRPAQVFSALAHGLTYAALCVVLVREATLIAAAGRVQAVLRWVLVTSLTLLAAGFVLVAPFLQSPDNAGAIGVVLGILMSVGFVGMVLGSLVLGPLLLRSPGLRTGARVLSAMLPVFGVTILLQFSATAWAHPAYLETTLAFGLALLGVDAVQPAPEAGSPAVPDTRTAADVSTQPGRLGNRTDR